MLQEHIQIVEETFSRLQQDSHKFMTSYYANFFEMAPHLRKSFPIDLRALQQEVNTTLAGIIANLDDETRTANDLISLARQHKQYGLKNSHCLVVLDALMRTLNQQLGKNFTFEAREAWATICFHLLNITAHPVETEVSQTTPPKEPETKSSTKKQPQDKPHSVSRAA